VAFGTGSPRGYNPTTGIDHSGLVLYTVQHDASELPSAPTGVSAVATGNGQASVSFTAPTPGSGGAITSYTVTASPGGKTAIGSTSPLTVNGLTAGTGVTFSVRAANPFGYGPASAPSNAVVPSAPPDAPTSVSANPGDGEAAVTFTAPSSDGGAPIVYYTATASPGGQSATGTGSPITVDGLTNGESYTLTVTATNAAGTGQVSAPSAPVVPLGPERPHPEPPAATPRVAPPDQVTPNGPRPPRPVH
jgi:hypothetical protein